MIIETQALSLPTLPDGYQDRHEIIWSLGWHGYTAREIATYLNEQEIRTPRGKRYYSQLVGATLSKLRRRKKRSDTVTVHVSKPEFWLLS